MEQPTAVELDAREDYQSKKKYIKPVLGGGQEIPSAVATPPILTPVAGYS